MSNGLRPSLYRKESVGEQRENMYHANLGLLARPPKVVQCVLLAFGDHPALEEEFQLEHAAARTAYDVIRGFLRLAAWLAFAWRAVARGADSATVAAMVGTTVVYSLAPIVLMVMFPRTCLRWRCYWLPTWNLAHTILVVCFYPYLYDLVPAGSTIPAAAAASKTLRPWPLLAVLIWLLWHSQALVMFLNACAPLSCTLRYFVHGQLLILLVMLRHNPEHCARHGQLQAAVMAVHIRLVLPVLRLVPHWAASVLPVSPAVVAADGGSPSPAAIELCATYLPNLQLVLGLLLPSVLVYYQEGAQRCRFLSLRSMHPELVVLRGEVAWALLAVALQLAAFYTMS